MCVPSFSIHDDMKSSSNSIFVGVSRSVTLQYKNYHYPTEGHITLYIHVVQVSNYRKYSIRTRLPYLHSWTSLPISHKNVEN